jgi:integrase
VFGDGIGRKVNDPKKAWATSRLKAAGHDPVWTATGALAPESQAVLDTLDLHFHDLRREGASRLLEAGWPLHYVSEMLGHADVKTTSTYLSLTRRGLLEAMRRFGTGPASLHNLAHDPRLSVRLACKTRMLQHDKQL